MRSSTPIPGNPWPHDMTLTIDDMPTHLLELLWIREAHRLQVAGDVPPLLSDTPEPATVPVTDATRSEWADAWPALWAEVAAHAGAVPDPRVFDDLQRSADSSTERWDLLRQLTGPVWRDRFGDEVFDDEAYRIWGRRGFDAHLAALPGTMNDSPERRDLDVLVPAWRRGLTKVVTIPCRGVYTRTLRPSALLVTDETRNRSASYREALAGFGAP